MHPFGGWQTELRQRGFAASATGGRAGFYMTRKGKAVSQAIGAMLHRNRPEEFSVVLHIYMPLRCVDPAHDVVLLSGDLSAHGVKIDDLLSHLKPGSTTWWPVERVEEAWTRIEQEGLAWLERFSNPESLIEHFEVEFAREESMPAGRQNSLLRRLSAKLTGRSSPRRSAHQQYLLWLAMLYEITGNIGQARDRLERYARMSPSMGDEAMRLTRHRQALENGVGGE